MKVEISSVQTSLEETIQYWKRYTACVDIFHVWLNDAEQVLQKPVEEIGVSKIYISINFILRLNTFIPIPLCVPCMILAVCGIVSQTIIWLTMSQVFYSQL